MTNDEIRIAVAEACGAEWRIVTPRSIIGGKSTLRILVFPSIYNLDGTCDLPKATGAEPMANLQYIWKEGCIPNYPESLDWMHEAEKTLSDDERVQYMIRLQQLERDCFKSDWHAIHSTAKQRAIEFLKVKGKWKE